MSDTDSAAVREQTDASLRAEREITDDLIESDQDRSRLDDLVRARLTHAGEELRQVRLQSDAELERQAAVLPAVSEKLEQVAGNLAEAAVTMIGAAGSLRNAGPSPAAGRAEPAQVANDVAAVARQLRETADEMNEVPPDAAEASGHMAEQLAAIAEGIAEVTSSLADERRDADLTLRTERMVTDQVIAQELEHVEDALEDELEQGQAVLEQQRQFTDLDLAEERKHTDAAVHHVLALLGEEQHAHEIAERNYATRNEFLSIVSHDLRGPLMAISGAAALMEQHATPDDAGRQMRGWADNIKRSVNMMQRLIGDLLDFGSFEDGRLRVAAERHDIRKTLRNAVDAFHSVAEGGSIALELHLPAEPMPASFDEHRILQVLSNLIHNAIKFTPKGGSICVTAARSGDGCIVSVADTGIGIPHTELTSIFQRFRQLTGRDRTGLGLGLYISMWIIEAHGGRIWAESEPGAGATFHFTLPD
jgi:signal transduction histidine kinase